MSTSHNRYMTFEPIADALRKVLDEQGISVRKLAGETGKDEETIHRYLRSHTVPDMATFRQLLLALPVAARVTVLRAAFHSFGVIIESAEPIHVTVRGPQPAMGFVISANKEMAEAIEEVQRATSDHVVSLQERLVIQEAFADVTEELQRAEVAIGA